MHNTRNWLMRVGALLVVAGCSLFEPQSRIKSGQLYTTGQAQYDDYFTKVHTLQVEAAGWADDKKATRRNLIDALKIATDAADVTILQSAHERVVAIAHVVGPTHLDLHEDDGKVIIASESRADSSTKDFVKALQATVDGEMKRKHSLRDVPQQCDELAKAGRELEPRVKADFFREGGTKMADVHDEIAASFDVLEQISKNARLERRETEDFMASLGRAVISEQGDRPEGTPPPSTSTSTNTKPTPPPAQTSHPKPPVANTSPAVSKPKPPPSKPAGGGGGDEVFNP